MEKFGNDLRINIDPIQTKREVGVESITASNQGKDQQPLSPISRLFHEPKSNLYIILVVGVKGSINPDIVKAGAVRSLLKHPRFSSVQVVDKEKGNEMKWVRTEVDIDKHIIVPNINPSLDSPDKFVEDYVSNLCKSTIDMSIPLWEVHLLNVKTSHADAVEVFRIHHSIGDGVSLMYFFLSFWPKVSNPEAFLTLPTVKNAMSSNDSKGLRENFWLFWNTHIDVLMVMATTLFLKDTKTPMSTPAGVGPTPWRFVHRIVSLDDIKLVKKAMNATINDVVMGVTQAALSKYMNRIYGNTKTGQGNSKRKNDYLPRNFHQRAFLIVNLRESAELPDMMKKDTKVKWGNMFSPVLLPLNIALRDDPLDYVRSAKATIERKKHSIEALCTFHVTNFILKIFGSKVGGYLYNRVSSHMTLTFSNVMGPSEEVSIFGNEITYLAPSVYGAPNALMIHFQSYANKMSFSLTVDERAIPDPHQLCDDIEESLKLIKSNVVAEGCLTSRM